MIDSVLYFGARDHHSLWQVIDHIQAEPEGTRVVSGHARGVDATAEFVAQGRGLEVHSYPARWKKEGTGTTDRAAGFDRNKVMVEVCTRAKGFLWPGCKGSLHTEKLLHKSGKPFEMIEPNLQEVVSLLFTSVHRSSRQGRPYLGPGAVDVSSRSFSSTWVRFAPSPELLSDILQKRAHAQRSRDEDEANSLLTKAWDEYVPAYQHEMRKLYLADPDAFLKPLRETNFAVMTCYCPGPHEEPSRFSTRPVECHRRLLMNIFVKVGVAKGIRVIDGGEIDVGAVARSKQSFATT